MFMRTGVLVQTEGKNWAFSGRASIPPSSANTTSASILANRSATVRTYRTRRPTLDAGHFALDTKADEIAALVPEFMKTLK
jgi:hypothetical protein